MKIGFLVKTLYAVGNPANGVAVQARCQARALSSLGHEVVLLNPWECQDLRQFDVLQFFFGGFGLSGIEKLRTKMGRLALIYAPILDSNEPNHLFRLAAWIGNVHPRLLTAQGEYRKQALASDAVVCRSTYEQQRLIKGLGVPEERTSIVLNGVEVAEKPPGKAALWDRLRAKWGLQEDFVLHVSEYTSQRKNVARLIEAVGPLGYPLVVAGWSEPGSVQQRLGRLAQAFPQVKLLGFLSREERDALYAGCRVFCLPSLHEGTGLVALEAATFGANIVITRNGAPPDYFGSYALYVDPYNVPEIRKATERAWNMPRTNDLRARALTELTWEQSAKGLLATYDRVLRGKSG